MRKDPASLQLALRSLIGLGKSFQILEFDEVRHRVCRSSVQTAGVFLEVCSATAQGDGRADGDFSDEVADSMKHAGNAAARAAGFGEDQVAGAGGRCRGAPGEWRGGRQHQGGPVTTAPAPEPPGPGVFGGAQGAPRGLRHGAIGGGGRRGRCAGGEGRRDVGGGHGPGGQAGEVLGGSTWPGSVPTTPR